MTKKKLTEKQLKFIEFYLESGNATQSAIRAGYSEKTAYSIGSENLKKPEIQEELERRRNEIKDELQKRFVDAAAVAYNVMFQVMNDIETPAKDKITAAKDFLDRAGFKPTDKKDIDLKGEIDQVITVNLIDEEDDEE